MKMRMPAILVAVLFSLFMAVPHAMGAEPLKIGIIVSTTGSQANFGTMVYNSNMMSFEHDGIKELDGRPIQFVVEDDEIGGARRHRTF